MLNVCANAGLPVNRRYADGFQLTFPCPARTQAPRSRAT